MTEQTTDIITVKAPTTHDLVTAVVGANGNLPLARERLIKKGFLIDQDDIVANLASDPTASELIAKQFRMKASLTSYQMLMAYQAELLGALGDDERPLSQQGAVQGFSAISSFFNSLTENRGIQVFSGTPLDKIMAVVPDPNVRAAITLLAAAEPIMPAPTPIRKQGRPTGAQNKSTLAAQQLLDEDSGV